MEKTKNKYFLLLCALFVCLCLCAWLRTPRAESLSERRKLAQMPTFSLKNWESGIFSKDFESYSQDQFPLREPFRQLKALFSTRILGRLDNNNIYEEDGFYAQLEYPENLSSATYAAQRFQEIHSRYLQPSQKAYLCVIPDKGYFLRDNPKMDYTAFIDTLKQGTPFAEYIDIFPTLTLESYYRTDTHWRQEALLPTAQTLLQGMEHPGAQSREAADSGICFLGVYAGQSAMPMAGEPLYYISFPFLDSVRVRDLENGKDIGIYNPDALTGKDPYEFFLSGSLSLISMENPQAATEDKLIVFRDSFGSSIAPYFLESYREVILVDIRYIPTERLGMVLDFENADVLFLYSTLVLNQSQTLK